MLPFRNYATSKDGNWVKNYRAAYQDCQHCPLKMSCTPAAPQQKFVRSAFDAAYRRAWHRQHSRAGQQMRRLRQRTVEPVFGSLLHHYGLRRVGTKGQAAAHKTMLLSAIAYNLKKLLKHQPKQPASVALALYPAQQGPYSSLFSAWLTDSNSLQVSSLTECLPTWSSATATTICSI
ncbi:transposase [Hymenobacter sp. BRD67]|uniref:transposase n=1 Tax=Hymenobacter sp. BRD67 TaxID=2675877 RepID=UPI0015674BE1|nr:transposase [Hymenobacter sp. BRD67]